MVDKIINIAQLKKMNFLCASVLPKNIAAANFFYCLGFEVKGNIFAKNINKLNDEKHKLK